MASHIGDALWPPMESNAEEHNKASLVIHLQGRRDLFNYPGGCFYCEVKPCKAGSGAWTREERVSEGVVVIKYSFQLHI